MADNITGMIQGSLSDAIALLLWESEAVKIEHDQPFKLASGNFSPIYINCRQVISNPAFMNLFTASARLICNRTRVLSDVIAGGETAGIPFGAYLAQSLSLPFVYVRKAAKGHGIANLIEGGEIKDKLVLLVEDLITDAGSKLHFIEAIRGAGGDIEDVLVLFDRLQGGKRALENEGIQLHALTDLKVTLEVAVKNDLLTSEQFHSVTDYIEDPRRWHEIRGLKFCE